MRKHSTICGAGAHQAQARALGAEGREQKAGNLDAVAHHIGEDAAALLLALPEPGLVRAAVLLRGAGQVRLPLPGPPRRQIISLPRCAAVEKT